MKENTGAVVWLNRTLGMIALAITGTLATLTASVVRGQEPKPVAAVVIAIVGGIVAVGVFLGRRWALIGFSAACAYYAIQLLRGSLGTVPFPLVLINVTLVILFLTPMFLTLRTWRHTRW